MASDFVPFVPGAPRPAAAPFSPACGAGGDRPPGPAAETNVELQREGGRVTQIRIQCRCGELIVLDCEV